MRTTYGRAIAAAAAIALSAAFIAQPAILRRAAPTPTSVASAGPTAQALDSATVVVRGRLTAEAQAALAEDGGKAGMLIVLRGNDRRVCEDLGRQLRELLRDGPDRRAALLVTENAAVAGYRAYARREHLRVQVVPLAPGAVLVDQPRLATPAVLILTHTPGEVAGIAHPRRFRNLRPRSFAAELPPVLRSPGRLNGRRDQLAGP